MLKKASFVVFVLALLAAGFFVINQGNQVQETAASPAIAAPPTPDTAVYWETVHEAEAAYKDGRFAEAMTYAQQAAVVDPTNPAAWDVYRQAAVAQAGDDYLSGLPASRYRINTEHFLADKANGINYFIIDVREPDEYAAGHIEGAINIPLHEVGQNLDLLPDGKSTPILVYCHTQKRATHALVVLRELGYTNVWNLEGGIKAYDEWTAVNPMPTPGPTATPEPEPPSC